MKKYLFAFSILLTLILISCGELEKQEVFYAESLTRDAEYLLETVFYQSVDFELNTEIKTTTNSKHTLEIIDSEIQDNTIVLYGLNSSDSVRIKRAVYEGIGRFIHSNMKMISHYPTENETSLFAEAFRNSFELTPDAAFLEAKGRFEIRQTDIAKDTTFKVMSQGNEVNRAYFQLKYVMETPIYYELEKLYNPKKND